MPRRFLIVWLAPDKELSPKLVPMLLKRHDVSDVEIGMTTDEKADALIALSEVDKELRSRDAEAA